MRNLRCALAHARRKEAELDLRDFAAGRNPAANSSSLLCNSGAILQEHSGTSLAKRNEPHGDLKFTARTERQVAPHDDVIAFVKFIHQQIRCFRRGIKLNRKAPIALDDRRAAGIALPSQGGDGFQKTADPNFVARSHRVLLRVASGNPRYDGNGGWVVPTVTTLYTKTAYESESPTLPSTHNMLRFATGKATEFPGAISKPVESVSVSSTPT